jgi:hypothetical protein
MRTLLTVLISLTLAAAAVAESRQGDGSRGSPGGARSFSGASVRLVGGSRVYGAVYYGGYGYPYRRYYYAPHYYTPYYYTPYYYAPYYYDPYYYDPHYYSPYAYGYPYRYYAPLVPRVAIALRPGAIVSVGWRLSAHTKRGCLCF